MFPNCPLSTHIHGMFTFRFHTPFYCCYNISNNDIFRRRITLSKVGVNIRNFRESKGMTLEQLALKVRCGTKTIENYENGTSIPNLDTILKISTALDVPASEFLDEKTHRPI